MLYTTTRNNTDTFTAQRVLISRRSPDGGQFIPFRLPTFSWEELVRMSEWNVNSRMAVILNQLFGTHVSGYDLDLRIGRNGVRMQQLGQRLVVAECWHNPQWTFWGMKKELSQVIAAGREDVELTGWADTGIRIAVLFGLLGELIRNGITAPGKPVDISVVSGNFFAPMAAWYARGMGLPIGNIVCCCNDNGALWDFICHGQLRMDGVTKQTFVEEADIQVPDGLEQLIALYGGPSEAERFAECFRTGNTYYLDDNLLNRMRKGIYATVSSERKILSTVSGVFSAHQYVLAPSSALAYAGLQDYRARTGISRLALIMTDKSSILETDVIADIIGISAEEMKVYF